MQKFLTFFICFFLTISLFAQNSKKADKAYDEGDYGQAIEEYTLLLDEVSDPQEKARYKYRIGESYRKKNRPDRAEKHLLDAIKNGYMSGDVYFSLGEAQIKLGKYDDALSAFEVYKRSYPSDPLADARIQSCRYAKTYSRANPFFKITSLEYVNSRKNDFGVSYLNDGIIFSSTRNSKVESDKKEDEGGDEEEGSEADRSNQVFTKTGWNKAKVFTAAARNGVFGRASEVTELSNMKNFADDGIFSYDPYSRQGLYAFRDGKNGCIQLLQLKGNKWEKGEKICVNSKKEPIGHPFISSDGNRIYFTSIMPGGFGKSDIWYIERAGKGWSEPINAGDKVNTAGNEVYPVIGGDYLFFSSDGHPGYGGFDLYAAKLDNGTVQKAPVNLGLTFNNSYDDYNIAFRTDLEEGVFVSGRNTKFGDDIFYFKGFPHSLIASGLVTDKQTGRPIAGVTIELIQQSNNAVVEKTVTDTSGFYYVYMTPEQSYTIKVTEKGYPAASKVVVTTNERFVAYNSKTGTDLNFSLASNASLITGRVLAYRTAMALENEPVSLIADGKVVNTVYTDANGIYKFLDIKEDTKYTVKVQPKGYFSDIKQINVGSLSSNTVFNKGADLELEKMDLNKEILVDKVYFPSDKTNLLSESFPELDRWANLFIQNPQYKILITGYTDSRANSKTATDFTLRRAEAVRSYLLSRGVNANQLTAKGMGKDGLLIKNAKSEEEHVRNNRIAFTVTSVDGASTSVANTITPVTQQKPVAENNVVPVTQQKPTTGTTPTNTSATASTPTTSNAGDYASLPYRVQVVALKTIDMNVPVFKKIKSEFGWEVRHSYPINESDVYHRYYVGGFATKAEADSAAAKLKAKGIDCMVKPKW